MQTGPEHISAAADAPPMRLGANQTGIRTAFTIPPHPRASLGADHNHLIGSRRRNAMSGFVRVLAALLLVGLLVSVGIGVYNAGVSEGVAEAARAAQAAGEDPAVVYPPYVGGPGYGYGHGWGWGAGFGFFGFLFFLLFVFLIFGLIRAAFGWGRWGGGGRGPSGHGWGGREERMAEYHRELHRRESDTQPSTSS
jgi:hypothetical protein